MSKQAKELCAGVRILHDETVELADQVLFMAKKLRETKKLIKDEPLCIEYDNGGGQTGVRENPSYKAYEKLMAAYTKALRQLNEILADAPPAVKTDILSRLSVIADRKVG